MGNGFKKVVFVFYGLLGHWKFGHIIHKHEVRILNNQSTIYHVWGIRQFGFKT